MLTSIDTCIELISKNFSDYHKLFSSRKVLLIVLRIIMYIPTVIFIVAVNFSILFIEGTKQMFLQPLLANKKMYLELEVKDDSGNSAYKFDNILRNYVYSAFEVFVLATIYFINLGIFAVKGSSNLVFIFLSFSNERMYIEL